MPLDTSPLMYWGNFGRLWSADLQSPHAGQESCQLALQGKLAPGSPSAGTCFCDAEHSRTHVLAA